MSETIRYTGDSNNWKHEPQQFPSSAFKNLTDPDPKLYKADDELIKAVNVAIMLGQPLLLTGEPGTGKTQLANNVASEFGLGKALKYEAKSTTTASDLFYQFDHQRYFRDSSNQKTSKPQDYITLNALGIAILRTKEEDDDLVQRLWDFKNKDINFEGPWKPRSSVVLIDEIDKTPRDVPNDLLNEIEHKYFKIPELDNCTVAVDKKSPFAPLVIITSNSERGLPEPFLRRCVYYDIQLPNEDKLTEILANRIEGYTKDSKLLNEVVERFTELRKVTGLSKKPTTGELLAWMLLLNQTGANPQSSLKDYSKDYKDWVVCLAKKQADQEKTEAFFKAALGIRDEPKAG